MKARLLDLSISLSGKQRLTIELDGDFRATWDELHEKDCEVTVKRFQNKRSLQANAYCWTLVDKIASKKRIPRAEAYRNAIRDIGGVSDIVCVKNIALEHFKREWEEKGIGYQTEEFDKPYPGWTNVIIYYGSSSYDTSQMSALIDSLVQDAKALGIETEDENKINSLLEEYENVESHRNSGKARS